MALQCVLGAGRTGKTDYIYQQMIKESMENRDENFFFLVPDQSTLNAQRELITRHPNHGTMNIDVVGFYRLSKKGHGGVPKGSSRVRFRHGKAGLYR